MIQAGVQSYFAINQAQDTIAAKQHGNVIKQPFMSFGSFATYVHPTQRYGIIFGASPKGMNMDIDRIMYQAVSKDNSTEELKGFILSQGPRESANEYLVPEQLFDDPKTAEKEAQGISAVKALQIAAQQGQTIYTVTKANYAEILPKFNHDSETMNDIRNAVNAGKVVTVHASAINHLRWHGTGYIITDTATGAGAYMISGGFNGGDLQGLNDFNDFLGFLSEYVLEPASIFLKVDFPIVSQVIDFISVLVDGFNGLNDCGYGGLARAVTISLIFLALTMFMSWAVVFFMTLYSFSSITIFLGTILINQMVSKAADDAQEAGAC